MKPEWHFSNKAVEDLTAIWFYTADVWSEAQADKYYNILVDACRQIAFQPEKFGKAFPEILAGLYGYRIGKHIIFYRTLSSLTVEIVRILHASMDLKNRIGE